MSTVSIVIPCRDEADFIEQLLDAVRRQDLAPLEVIIVDNGSRDASVAVAAAYATRHPELTLRVLACPRQGAAAAMNTGIQAAVGDIIVRLDGHSTPSPDYL